MKDEHFVDYFSKWMWDSIYIIESLKILPFLQSYNAFEIFRVKNENGSINKLLEQLGNFEKTNMSLEP